MLNLEKLISLGLITQEYFNEILIALVEDNDKEELEYIIQYNKKYKPFVIDISILYKCIEFKDSELLFTLLEYIKKYKCIIYDNLHNYTLQKEIK